MKIPENLKNIALILFVLLVLGVVVYIYSTATMSMGDFSGNGR